MILSSKQREELKKVVKPVMKYLGNPKIFHPHIKIIIENGRAELVEGIASVVIEDYIPD